MFAVLRSLARHSSFRFVAVAVGISLLWIGVGDGVSRAQKTGPKDGRADDASSPIFGVKIPDGYRKWELVSVSEAPDKNELKAIFGNGVSMKAYQDGSLPFPDGSTLVKLTWKREPLDGFDGAFVPGPATMVQVMVKDSKKYVATGGWGFGRFVDGKAVDAAQHQTCFACHSRNKTVREQDFVFTRLAP
jgi:hypothetical protein